jgi:hypothetical protein
MLVPDVITVLSGIGCACITPSQTTTAKSETSAVCVCVCDNARLTCSSGGGEHSKVSAATQARTTRRVSGALLHAAARASWRSHERAWQ